MSGSVCELLMVVVVVGVVAWLLDADEDRGVRSIWVEVLVVVLLL